MPGLAAFGKKHVNAPFRLLGVHCQNDTDDNIIALCKQSGVEFSILQSGEYPKKQFSGIPHAFVFDHTGKEIFEGHPSEAEKIVEKALESAPSLYLGDLQIEKLKPLAMQISRKANLGQAAATLRKKTASEDAAEKAEAESLLKALEGYAQRRTASANASREEDPDRTLAELKALSKEFAGDTLGTDAAALAKAAETDPALQNLRKAVKDLAAQEKALDALAPCKACKQKNVKTGTLGCTSCRQANAELVTKARKALEGIAKKYEGTAVAKKASELAGKL